MKTPNLSDKTLSCQRVLIGILAICLMAMALLSNAQSFTASNMVLDYNQFQSFTASNIAGLSPFSFNFLIYNPSNVLVASNIITSTSNTASYAFQMNPTWRTGTYTANVIANSMQSQPDVLIVHSNGIMVGYNATANTNQARGIALMSAISNEVSGDSVYLKAETYNLSNNGISLMANTNLYGAGKYSTIISSTYSGAIIWPATNTITSDLSSISTASAGTGAFPWGLDSSGTVVISNAVLRNAYLQGQSDGVYYESDAGGSFNAYIYNITTNSLWDSITLDSSSTTGNIFIFDSNIVSMASPIIDNGHNADGIINYGEANIIVVNTVVMATNAVYGGPVSTSGNRGIYEDGGGSIYVYGGSASTSALGTAPHNDIINQGTNLAVNSTFSYVTHYGTITSLGASPYGPYTYDHSPMTPPSYYAITQNSLNFIVNNALMGNIINTFNVIPSGSNSLFRSIPSGGTPSYSYKWYIQCPTCASYLIQPSTTNTMQFNQTTIGVWNVLASIKDSASTNVIFNATNSIFVYGRQAQEIMPNQTYPYIPIKFHLKINDSIPLQSLTWVFNGVAQAPQTITTNGTYNFTTTYNAVGSIALNAIITDSGMTDNTFYSNQIILYKPYINPTIVLPIYPSSTLQNNDTTLSIDVVNGSFKANTITWEINGNYVTNIAFNGINYQSYDFPLAGLYNIMMQVCDVNGFCSSNSGTVTAIALIPNSFWHVEYANLQNLTYPADENMRITFEPYNDTNPISNVTVNWGDRSPLYRVQYQKPITGDLYIHPYANSGYYNISETVCDTLDNCFSQDIGRISDLTPSQKGWVSVLSSFFLGGAIPTGNFSIPSLGITVPSSSSIIGTIPTNWGNLVITWAIAIIIVLALLWVAYQVIIAKLHKHAANWAPFGKR